MSSALDLLVRKHPEMAPAAVIVRTLATALPEAVLPPGLPHPAAAEIRLAAGVPALDGEVLLTGGDLRANVRVLARALSPTSSTMVDLSQLEHMFRTEADDLASAAQSGAWDLIVVMAQRSGVEPDGLVTLFDHAARPTLRAAASVVRGVIERSRWNRGTCPACGAAPLLGELRGGGTAVGGAEQERVLRCGRCLTGWSFPRLRCVACGETKHQNLSYLHGSDEGTFRRAEVCSTCGYYIKSIAVLSPLTYIDLLDVDLVTAALDVGAMEHGFHRQLAT